MPLVLPLSPTPQEPDLHSRISVAELANRLRTWLLAAIIIVGFWAPFPTAAGSHAGSAWLFLSGVVARNGGLGVAQSSIAVMAAALFFALAAALLRTWGSAQPTTAPRYHPFPVGDCLTAIALSILMRPAGALFTVLAAAALTLAVIAIGNHPTALRLQEQRTSRPHWRRGFLRELFQWGVVVTYAAFAARYNTTLLEQGVLVSLGIGIIARALFREASQSEPVPVSGAAK